MTAYTLATKPRVHLISNNCKYSLAQWVTLLKCVSTQWGETMWENKVINWCLPKYSKREFEVLSSTENDIITARKHFRAQLRLWKQKHIAPVWHVTLLTTCPWGFSDAMRDICSVNLTWQSECSVVNKKCFRVFKLFYSLGSGTIYSPLNCQLSGSNTFYKCAEVNRIFFLIRKGRQSSSFKALRAISPYQFRTSRWRSTLIHYYVKFICLMKGKSHSGPGGLP